MIALRVAQEHATSSPGRPLVSWDVHGLHDRNGFSSLSPCVLNTESTAQFGLALLSAKCLSLLPGKRVYPCMSAGGGTCCSPCFVVPTKPCCLQRSSLAKQRVTHTVNLGSAVLGANMSNPKRLSNTVARSDNLGPIVEFGSISRISCASSWSSELVNCRHGVTK